MQHLWKWDAKLEQVSGFSYTLIHTWVHQIIKASGQRNVAEAIAVRACKCLDPPTSRANRRPPLLTYAWRQTVSKSTTMPPYNFQEQCIFLNPDEQYRVITYTCNWVVLLITISEKFWLWWYISELFTLLYNGWDGILYLVWMLLLWCLLHHEQRVLDHVTFPFWNSSHLPFC